MNPACIGSGYGVMELWSRKQRIPQSSEENCYFKLIKPDSTKQRTLREAAIRSAVLVVLCAS
jgi:hypothetical protein